MQATAGIGGASAFTDRAARTLDPAIRSFVPNRPRLWAPREVASRWRLHCPWSAAAWSPPTRIMCIRHTCLFPISAKSSQSEQGVPGASRHWRATFRQATARQAAGGGRQLQCERSNPACLPPIQLPLRARDWSQLFRFW